MVGLMIELFVCAIKHNCLRKYLRMGDMDLEIQPGSPYNLPPEQHIYQPQLILYKKKFKYFTVSFT